jgi:ankyrin repeat protein
VIGVTPLMSASNNGHESIVEMLLKHGANINDRGKNGETAITVAANENISELLKNYQRENTVVMADLMLDEANMSHWFDPYNKENLYQFMGGLKRRKSNKRRKTKKRRRKTVKKQRKYKKLN